MKRLLAAGAVLAGIALFAGTGFLLGTIKLGGPFKAKHPTDIYEEPTPEEKKSLECKIEIINSTWTVSGEDIVNDVETEASTEVVSSIYAGCELPNCPSPVKVARMFDDRIVLKTSGYKQDPRTELKKGGSTYLECSDNFTEMDSGAGRTLIIVWKE